MKSNGFSPEMMNANWHSLAGIGKVREEITKAEESVRGQYKKLQMRYHPDRNFGRDTAEASQVVSDLHAASQEEFASAREWLNQQEEALKSGGAR
jgi:hypothetical protein